MYTNQNKYKVYIREYTQRHYIKVYEKKYSKSWDITLEAIVESLGRVDMFLTSSKAEIILSCHEKKKHILKCEFRVAGTKDSAHSSGNRYIVYLDEELHECHILLLYGKENITGQETAWWKIQIRENYPDIRSLFPSL